MEIKSIKNLKIPTNLKEYLTKNEFWEDESFEPFYLTIEEVIYKDEEMISFQAEFEINENYPFETSYDLEDKIREYIYQKDQNLLQKIKSDSESSTCVLWVNDESDFRKMFGFMIEIFQNELK